MKYTNYTTKEIALNIVNATNASPTNRLAAIKEYRHATNCSLADAKEAINTAIENKVFIELFMELNSVKTNN